MDAKQQERVRALVRDKFDLAMFDFVSVAVNVGKDTVKLDDGPVCNARDVELISENSKSSTTSSFTFIMAGYEH